MNITRIALITLITAGTALSATARPGGSGPRGGNDMPFGLEAEDIVGAIFAKHDTNLDDLLSSDEIAASVAAKIEARQARAAERGVERERPDDFTPPTPEEIAAKMIERHDADEDGALSTEEVLGTLKQQKRRGKGGPRGGEGRGKRGPRAGVTE